MDKLTQFNQMFNELRAQGRVRTQNDLAELIGAHKSTISLAMKGDPRYLTESLLSKMEKALLSEPLDVTDTWRVPLIPIEAHAGHLSDFADTISDCDCERVVSPVRGAAFAIQVTGDSMSPAYPSGAKIFCQKVNESAFIEWGRVYLLDTVNGAILKQVRKSDKVGYILCCSLNPSPEYAPFELDTQHIIGWYRVLMIMSLV